MRSESFVVAEMLQRMEQQNQLLRPHAVEVAAAIAFSPDGQLVVAGAGNGVVQVWRATTEVLQSQFNTMPGKILTVEFDPASKLVAAADAHDRLRFYAPDRNTRLVDLETPSRVRMLRSPPDGLRLSHRRRHGAAGAIFYVQGGVHRVGRRRVTRGRMSLLSPVRGSPG